MPRFKVPVEKYQYIRGTFEITAANAEEARDLVQSRLDTGGLEEAEVYAEAKWETPSDDSGSLVTIEHESPTLVRG